MTKDDSTCLKLGREVVRMIVDLQEQAKKETGYARRKVTFPGGSVVVLVVNDPALADKMEAAASAAYDVKDVQMPSAGS